MDQNDNRQNDFLYTLLANPVAGASAYLNDLQRLVSKDPQSGILQALLAHASDEKNLKKASAYYNPRLLYKLVNNASSFANVNAGNIYIQPALRKTSLPGVADDVLGTEKEVNAPGYNNYFSEQSSPANETLEEVSSNDQITETVPDTDVAEHTPDEQVIPDHQGGETPVQTPSGDSPVEFYPGLENIMPFEAPFIHHEVSEDATGTQQTDDYTTAFVHDPVFDIEKDKDDPSANRSSIIDIVEPDVSGLNLSPDTSIESPAEPAEVISIADLNLVNAEEDTYSGSGKIEQDDQNGIENGLDMENYPESTPPVIPNTDSAEPDGVEFNKLPTGGDIDDEVYDEITGIDQIQLNVPASPPVLVHPATLNTSPDDEENKLIIENIATTDFFMFDDAFGSHSSQDNLPIEPETKKEAGIPDTTEKDHKKEEQSAAEHSRNLLPKPNFRNSMLRMVRKM